MTCLCVYVVGSSAVLLCCAVRCSQELVDDLEDEEGPLQDDYFVDPLEGEEDEELEGGLLAL